ncbi:hypothetical protein, partial [Alcanivorax sp. HI0003]|uniref:hypothetical protein n=1 Tax=Alcanivorax sp. HI0003 TaxID=1822217 RepID=UPI001E2DF345
QEAAPMGWARPLCFRIPQASNRETINYSLLTINCFFVPFSIPLSAILPIMVNTLSPITV